MWSSPFRLLASAGLACLLTAQQPAADCRFTADPDEYLNRAARARQAIATRIATLALPASRAASADSIPRRNFVDDAIFAPLAAKGVASAPLSSDEEFFRRITLDLTGRIPSSTDVRRFVADGDKDKRDAVIDRLLESPEFTDRWTMWMGDWLQNTSALVNAAQNRGTAGRNAFHAYLRDAVGNGKSLAVIAGEAIAGKGNNGDAPAGAANFALGASTSMGPIQDTYDTMLVRTATMFLGLGTYDCLLCHNGRGRLTVVSAWGVSQTRLEAQRMAAFFSRMRFSPAPGRTFDVADASEGTYDLNTDSGNRPSRAPVGSVASLTPEYRVTRAAPRDGNWRAAFAEQMIEDPMFARNLVNRLWKQMFGLALVDPVDSLDPARLDPKNPPAAPWELQATHPELLEELAAELARQKFSLRGFLRLLAQSSAYQLSSRYQGQWNDENIPLFARHYARRLESEEVHDAIVKSTGVPADYNVQGTGRVAWAMQLPEPIEPAGNTPVLNFLNAFLRGDRDTQERSQAGSIQQQLYLMNDALVTDRLKMDRSPALQALARITSGAELVDELYLTFLSRSPSAAERAAAMARLAGATGGERDAVIEDLAWMCINKVEFLFSY